MRDLRALQQNFQHFLLQKNANILSEIVDVPPVAAQSRLEIYEEGYYLRLLESLQSDFAVLSTLLGEAEFDRIGRLYIQKFPSTFRSIRWFGKTFATFLRESDLLKDKPWLIELAEFEWTLTEIFDGKDFSVITVEDMMTVPSEAWPTLRFKLQPLFKMIYLNWIVPAIWLACKENKKIPKLKSTQQPIPWRLWRNAYEVQFASLPQDEEIVLKAMMNGATFSEICEMLCEWIDPAQVALYVSQLLKRFILDNLLAEPISSF